MHTVTSAIALVCYSVLTYVTARHRPQTRAHRYFVAYLVVMVLWQITLLLVSLSSSASMALFWYELMVVALTSQFLVYYLFVHAFLGTKPHDLVLSIGCLSCVASLAFGVGNSPDYLAGVHRHEITGLFVPDFGVFVLLLTVVSYTILAVSIRNLFLGYKRAESHDERVRIRVLLVGTGATVTGILANFSYALQGYPVDVLANIVNALLIAYAMLRYRLLDITLVLRKGVLYSVPTAVIGFGYLLIVLLAVNLFHVTTGYQFLLLYLVVAALTAVAVQPVWSRAQSWVDRLFFREKYDSSLMLQRLSRGAASILDLDILTGMILEEMTATMHIQRAALFLKQEESGEFRLSGQRGLEHVSVAKLRKDHPVVSWLAKRKQVLAGQEVDMIPQFKALWTEERAGLDSLEVQLFVPLVAREALIGVLVVGPKLSEMPYSPDEQRTLTTLANQTAVAIENARLHRETLEAKERIETIVKQAFAGIMVVDSDMRIVTVNPEVEAISGHSTTELVGIRLPDVFGPELWGEKSLLASVMASGKRVAPSEVILVGKSGARDILLGITPIHEGYLLNLSDITRLKDVERLKTNIVANVSHELRAPLASIKAYTELLLANLEGDDPALRHRFLSIIDQEADWLTELISDLLDLSRLESGQYDARMDLLALSEIVASTINLLDIQVRKRAIEVCVDMPSPLPLILADRELLTILVKNLVSNAVKFSAAGGRVDVRVSATREDLLFEVEDRGMGIAPEDLPHLFTKFYRSRLARDRGIRGTGLGLVLAKDAVELHGGRIEIETQLGEGTHVTVTLPRNLERAGAAYMHAETGAAVG